MTHEPWNPLPPLPVGEEIPWQLQALRNRVADGHVTQSCPVASIDWILEEREQLRAKVERYESAAERYEKALEEIASGIYWPTRYAREALTVEAARKIAKEALAPTKGEIKK